MTLPDPLFLAELGTQGVYVIVITIIIIIIIIISNNHDDVDDNNALDYFTLDFF